jgi:hypothetical protein
MDLIPLQQTPQHATPACASLANFALAGVIGCVGQGDFSAKALGELNRVLPMCWMSIYRLFAHAPPESYGGGAFGIADGTRDSWRVYRRGLYSQDRTFLAAREVTARGGTALTRWHAREIPMEHRKAIYLRHGLRERVSLVEGDAQGGVLAVNLYRGMEQPSFRDDEVDLLCSLAPPLLATVQLHLRLTAAHRAADGGSERWSERWSEGWNDGGSEGAVALTPGRARRPTAWRRSPGCRGASARCASGCCAAGPTTASRPTWAFPPARSRPTATAPSSAWDCITATSFSLGRWRRSRHRRRSRGGPCATNPEDSAPRAWRRGGQNMEESRQSNVLTPWICATGVPDLKPARHARRTASHHRLDLRRTRCFSARSPWHRR